MGWNLFLDDLRNPDYLNDNKSYIVARSTAQAQAYVILYGAPDYMSLDYDLGDNDTAEIFVKWLFNFLSQDLGECDFAPCPKWNIHSDNGPGRAILNAYLRSWDKAYKASYTKV
jgi:hypothetical protein